MPHVIANDIRIEYDTRGDSEDPTVLLIMGLGHQLTMWHASFCDILVESGYHVVRFDNRDAGLSESFDEAGKPNIMGAMMGGERLDAPYTLDDMAADAVGLLDALEIDSAHVAGASMGGMIAQTIAINHPDRVDSLTSIMSTTGNRSLPQATPEAMQALLTPPAPEDDEEAAIERSLRIWDVLESPAYPTDEETQRTWLRRDYRRSYNPTGIARQLAAIIAHGDRREGLRELDIPVVVLHGADDPLIRVEAGKDTAETIPGAELRIVEGMAHDFPLELVEEMANAVLRAARRAEDGS
jgi:pimeloyl-ACP methyl ester carboxylesterase